nr:hypothetical protein [Boldiaceae sp.]
MAKLDFILLTLQSLDIELLDRIIFSRVSKISPKLNYSTIHFIRLSNFYRIDYIETKFHITTDKIIYIIYLIHKILISENFRNLIENLVIFILDLKSNVNNNILVFNYLKRFKFYFRQYMNLYMVTKQVYYSDITLDDFAIQNLYIIYSLSRFTSIINFWDYIKCYKLYFPVKT